MFSTMTSSVTNWFGGGKEEETKDDRPTPEPESAENQGEAGQERGEKTTDTADEKQKDGTESEEKEKDLDIDLDEISAKALSTAKDWGNYLFNVGKAASSQVAKTAMQLKDTVEEKTMLGEFNREQEKFSAEKRDKKRDASVAPWVGYNEEEDMKKQILALSGDKRNFLRNPPSGVQFSFDYEASHPVAMAMLQEDPELKALRFELVPKQLKEDIFWRNYFYRVSLIKQSAQLTSLAQQTGSAAELPTGRLSESKAGACPKEGETTTKGQSEEPEDLPSSSPPDHEFISDSFQASESLDEDAIKKEMQQLGMTDKQNQKQEGKTEGADVAEWERELQAELQEYEVVDDGTALDDPDLEEELLQQIEAEANGQDKTA